MKCIFPQYFATRQLIVRQARVDGLPSLSSVILEYDATDVYSECLGVGRILEVLLNLFADPAQPMPIQECRKRLGDNGECIMTAATKWNELGNGALSVSVWKWS